MTEQKKNVEKLIERAANANDSADAMRLSQAALNAANALCSLAAVPRPRTDQQ